MALLDEWQRSDWISLGALILSFFSAGFTWYWNWKRDRRQAEMHAHLMSPDIEHEIRPRLEPPPGGNARGVNNRVADWLRLEVNVKGSAPVTITSLEYGLDDEWSSPEDLRTELPAKAFRGAPVSLDFSIPEAETPSRARVQLRISTNELPVPIRVDNDENRQLVNWHWRRTVLSHSHFRRWKPVEL